MKFGVPNQKKRKEEKYPDTPVVTIGIDGGKGTSRTMSFNKKAVELLSLKEDATVAFSFDDGIRIMNASQSQVPDNYGIKVTKNTPRRISEKKTYDYISKILELDNSVENEFTLKTNVQNPGEPINFSLVSLKEKEDAIEDTSNIIEEEKIESDDIIDNQDLNFEKTSKTFESQEIGAFESRSVQ